MSELRPLLRIAGPIILGEIEWMGMGIVDTLMVGPLGPAAIAATGIGGSVFTAIAIFGMGLMLGLDPLVSRSYGAKRLDECLRWLHHGVVLAVVVAPVVLLLTWGLARTMGSWGLHPETLALARPYLEATAVGALPALLYAAFRRYLQGLHIVGPIMAALLSANLINAAGNWILIYGHLGMPALMGVAMLIWHEPMNRAFTSDPGAIETGAGLLVIAAAFQVFDGTQAVSTGVLRGIGDTRMPMITNVIGHWVLGLPSGYVLCFVLGLGIRGLWFGLSIGLTFVAVALTIVWARRARHLA